MKRLRFGILFVLVWNMLSSATPSHDVTAQEMEGIEAWERFFPLSASSSANVVSITRSDLALCKEAAKETSIEALRNLYYKCNGGDAAKYCFDRLDKASFERAQNTGTVESLSEYLKAFPESRRRQLALKALDPILFVWAGKQDWYSAYEQYIATCPTGENVSSARARIEWLKRNPAVVSVDALQTVECKESPYSNVRGRFWVLNPIFKETGGKVGCRVKGVGYLIDSNGTKWIASYVDSDANRPREYYESGLGNLPKYGGSGPKGVITRPELNVPAGKTARDDYWIASSEPAFVGSYFIMTWTGEDAGGHLVSLEVKSKLVDTNHFTGRLLLGNQR